jgi:hypothetical protein
MKYDTVFYSFALLHRSNISVKKVIIHTMNSVGVQPAYLQIGTIKKLSL